MIEQGAFAIGYYNQKTANRRAARAGAERKQAKQQADLHTSENGNIATDMPLEAATEATGDTNNEDK
jgi:hypothetical protein